jgi:hypothetical protein
MLTQRTRRVLHEVALFAFFAFAAIALTWPFVLNVGTALSDLGDPLLNTWILDWDVDAILHQPLHVFDSPMYYPARLSLAYSENMLMIAIIMLPFRLLGLAPIAAYGIATLLGFTVSGYGASVLARVLGRSRFAAILAGLLYAFCQYDFDHLAHLQILWCGWLPLMFAALFAYFAKPNWKRAALLGAAFLANGLTNIHFLLFGGLALAIGMAWMLIASPKRDLKFWIRLVVSLAIAGALLLPVLMPYRTVADVYGMRRTEGEILSGSASLSDWLVSNSRSVAWRWVWPDNERAERRLFPGLMPIVFLIAAAFLVPFVRRGEVDARLPRAPGVLIRALDVVVIVAALIAFVGMAAPVIRLHVNGELWKLTSSSVPLAYMLLFLFIRIALRPPLVLTHGEAVSLRGMVARSRFAPEEWTGIVLIAVGVIGSLGLNAFFHVFVVRTLFIFKSIRTPARWAIIAYVGLVIWSSLGIDALLRNRAGWKRIVICTLLATLTVADVLPATRWEHAVPNEPSVYTWMVRHHVRGPLLELPMNVGISPFLFLQWNMIHHQPIFNGTSGFEPPLHARLRQMDERGELNDVFLSMLEERHCRWIIVHAHMLDKPAVAYHWLQDNLSNHRLVLVERFTHGTLGDYIFAVTANNKEWEPLVHPWARDRSNRTDGQNLLSVFLGEMPYNEETFGAVESPEQDGRANGPLEVKGFAFSPDGIRRVDVYFYSRMLHYQAQLVPRPDVTKKWPWYPVPRPGFLLRLPKRPRGYSRMAEVQVKVTDGRGKELWLEDRVFDWQ